MVDTKYLTIVYRGIPPGDKARELCSHPQMTAVSWSHALHDRDEANEALKEAQERIAEMERERDRAFAAADAIHKVKACLVDERDAMAALLAQCRTSLADMDRACDRELIDRIDAAINTANPMTMLTLIDRIRDLENAVAAAEHWRNLRKN